MCQKERRYLPSDLRAAFGSTCGETRSRWRPRNPSQQSNWGFRHPHVPHLLWRARETATIQCHLADLPNLRDPTPKIFLLAPDNPEVAAFLERVTFGTKISRVLLLQCDALWIAVGDR